MKITMPFLILLTATAGCVTKVETGYPQPETPVVLVAQPRAITDKRVVIDPALNQTIQLVGIKSTTGPEGFLKIQVNIQNLTGSPKHISYRIDWFDRDGMELPMAASESLPWMLLSHETSFLAATSPTPTAKDFRVTFVGPGS
jgi:uncharacterized protein YcfL